MVIGIFVTSDLMSSALFWDTTQRRVVISYRRFGTIYRSYLQASRSLWTIKDRTDRLSPKRRYGIAAVLCVISWKSAERIYMVAETWNHSLPGLFIPLTLSSPVVTICTVQWSLYVPYSGHYMYRQFNIQQLYVLPTQTVFMCFVWIWEQTAIISPYSINWLVCITETECVYCAVRTGSLYIIQVIPCV